MSDGLNFEGFFKFADNFHKALQEESFVIDIMNQLGNIMIRDVKMKTPVNQDEHTVSFTSGEKTLFFEEADSIKQSDALRRNWILDGVEKDGDAYKVVISNNTKSGPFLENGYRESVGGWVDGQFFLKITMEEIMEQLPKIVGPAYKAYLERFGLA